MEGKVLGAYLGLLIQILANRASEFNIQRYTRFLNSKLKFTTQDLALNPFYLTCRFGFLQPGNDRLEYPPSALTA
jgi:hypothetical protein